MVTSIDHTVLATESEARLRVGNSKAGRVFLLIMFITLMIDAIPGFGIGIAPGLSAKNLYLYALCVVIAAKAVMNPAGLKFVDLQIHIPFLLIIAYAVVTLAISSILDPAYDEMKGVITLKNKLVDLYLLMFVFRYLVASRGDFIWLIRAIVIMMFLSSFLTLVDFLNIPDLGIVGTHKGRIEGPIGSANQYGALLAFLLPISISLMPEESRAGRWFWRIGIIITVILLIGTGSRGAYFATFAGSIIGAYLIRRHLNMRTVMRMTGSAIGIVMLLVVGFSVFNPDLLLSIFEKSTTGDMVTASSGRWAIWTAAFGVMLESPMSFLFGYGWNTFDTSGIWKSAHSEYVDRLFEMGIIGLSLFVALFWMIVKSTRSSLMDADGESRRLLCGFLISICILVIDIAFLMPYAAWTVIWIITGLMLGLRTVSDRDPDQTGRGSGPTPPAKYSKVRRPDSTLKLAAASMRPTRRLS